MPCSSQVSKKSLGSIGKQAVTDRTECGQFTGVVERDVVAPGRIVCVETGPIYGRWARELEALELPG